MEWRAEGLKEVEGRVLAWYDRERRTLPWREEPTPYRVWISEIMLQQTRVDTVIPYFNRFMERFPTVAALARAPLDDVLQLWSGLGYYSRARNLHRCANVVMDEWNGLFPGTVKELQSLPGIGRYTAGAIASIAFGERASLLDGNVIRVFSRWTDLSLEVGQTQTKSMLWDWADELVSQDRPGDFNQALMELGALVCTPRAPGCAVCPTVDTCCAHEAGSVSQRPVKAKKKKAKTVAVRAAIVRNEEGEVLLFQRKPEGLFGGLWEFPQQEKLAESDPAEVATWLKGFVNVRAHVTGTHGKGVHILTHRRMELVVYPMKTSDGPRPSLPDPYQGWRWVHEDALDTLGIGSITKKMLGVVPRQQELHL